jgi:arylsulfatase A-like enzyme
MPAMSPSALPLLVLSATLAAASDRPNVILFLVDDLGWRDVSVPMDGPDDRPGAPSRPFRTPNVRRLADHGMRFANAYASAPVCTPTRTSIMTGRSPARSGITYWTLHRDHDTSREHPTLSPPAWRLNGLEAGDVTLPGLLRDAGYRTIHVGKAHFGAHGTSGADPLRLGFEVNVAGHASGAPASYLGVHAFSAAGRAGEPRGAPGVWDVPGLDAAHGRDVYLTEVLASRAVTAIRHAVRDGRRFFLHFAPYAVHTPIMANPRYVERYADLDPVEAAYASMVQTVDAALGVLLITLDDLGLREETVIIFTSDNGGLSAHGRGGAPHTHNAPLRSGKGSAYEGGVRVPAIVVWPGVVPPGTICATPIVSHDLFPTVLALAGVPVPVDHAPTVDGRDLTPLLRGAPGLDPDRVLGWHQPHQWGADGPGIEPFTSLRAGDLKLIYFHAGPRFELYDLAADIGERHDLAPERPGRVRGLAARLDAWMAARGARLSIERATGRPVPVPTGAAAAGPAAGPGDAETESGVTDPEPADIHAPGGHP